MAFSRRLAVRVGVVVSAAVLAALLGGAIWAYRVELPPGALDLRRIAVVRILSRDGTLLRQVFSRDDGGAVFVPLERISPHAVQATLAGEDRRFFEHGGVDWLALFRALALNLARGRIVSGGSTITMQLARLTAPAPRTLRAKLREVVLAYKLERRLEKKQILALYLNRAPYGNQTFGIEAAARRYFNKPAAELSLAEAALLAALPRSPTGYNPFTHRERLVRRQRYLLALLAHQGRITSEQRRLALREPLAWETAKRPFFAPHFTERVLRLPSLGQATAVRTTLDLSLQERVEVAVRAQVARLRDKGVTNAAALVVDSASGEVLAYAGSADFWNEEDGGQNDGTLALRQPGSTLKPLTYALALERGLTAASLLRDLPVHYSTDQGDYAPRNYDDRFHGPVRLRVALGSSYNVPAVGTADFVGLDPLLARFRAAGLESLKEPARHYGLGLTLGNGEVTLQELVTAYMTLARGGSHLGLRLVLESRTPTGERISLPERSSRRVFDERAAYLVSHILSDPLARAPAFGRHSVLDVGFPAAVKTGTSKDFRDNWAVGFTPQVTVGVWVGNFQGASMHNVSGITGAGPLWAEIMVAAGRERSTRFTRPAGLAEREICPLSGELAGPHCGSTSPELFVQGTEPRATCSIHREITLDRRNGLRAGPGCPEAEVERRVFLVYPAVYRSWAASQRIEPPPTLDSPLCPHAAEGVKVSIRFPVEGDRYFIDPDLRRPFQRVPLEATVEGWVREVRWLVDGREVTRAGYPYSASWALAPGRHRIEAALPDGPRSAPVTITVK